MTTLQTEFTEAELLQSHSGTEPLMVGDVRCHGGLDDDGRYVSPRTLTRGPAIEAWQAKHRQDFGTEPIAVPLETWPEHVPNLTQARFLIGVGVPEPLIATLTRIGTLEGIGANIALLRPTGLQRHFVEDIAGTATDHLGRGLFEAHGRDEAGFEDQAGHRDMWFAARDLAFPDPGPDIDIEQMLERLGFGPSSIGQGPAGRLLPDDIDPDLEFMVTLMVRILLIEVQAFHTFAWAEAWLGDPDLVAGDGAAANIVRYIRADETPHVGYLATALTEMRDRTWIGQSGRHHSGADMLARIWEPVLDQSVGSGRVRTTTAIANEVAFWCEKSGNADVLAQYNALATPERDEQEQPTPAHVD